MKFGHVKRIHFVGIGGSGMSGIAQVLLDLGYDVSGSDLSESLVVKQLRNSGAVIEIGHQAEVVDGADVVVHSTAVKADNPEVVAAHQQRIPVIHRAEMLAELMRLKHGIAVAGAHGKTTTTSMIAHILEESGLDPTVVIGGKIKSLAANGKLGQGELIVVEADESDGSFLQLTPVIAILNNLDEEHLDYWKNYDALKSACVEFANSVPFYGTVLLCQDDADLAALRSEIRRPVRTYAVDAAADIEAKNIQFDEQTHFDLVIDSEKIGRFAMPIVGKHNVSNVLAAIGVALEVGVAPGAAAKAIANFPGIERRFEVLFDGGPIIVDDYGHHPVEIDATIQAARQRWPQPLTVVFQPHRYSRTEQLWDEFRSVLLKPDHVCVTDIYEAGEVKRDGIRGDILAKEIHDAGHPDARYTPFDSLLTDLPATIAKDHTVLFLGAGNISGKAHEFASTLA